VLRNNERTTRLDGDDVGSDVAADAAGGDVEHTNATGRVSTLAVFGGGRSFARSSERQLDTVPARLFLFATPTLFLELLDDPRFRLHLGFPSSLIMPCGKRGQQLAGRIRAVPHHMCADAYPP